MLDLETKRDAPGGAALLQHIGWIYTQEAKANSNRFFGFAYGLQKTGHYVSETFSLMKYVEYPILPLN